MPIEYLAGQIAWVKASLRPMVLGNSGSAGPEPPDPTISTNTPGETALQRELAYCGVSVRTAV